MDCADFCPVSCFAAGEVMLVINPVECIDCGLCEPACPTKAIVHDSNDRARDWLEINRLYSAKWPQVFNKGTPCADADEWNGRSGKGSLFSAAPASPSSCETQRHSPDSSAANS